MQPRSSASWSTSLERGTLRLTQLIDNLLESVRIESGQLTIRHQSVALRRGGRGRPRAGGLAAGAARPELVVELPDDLPLVSGDKTRLTQVFVNLIANANKFAPEGSVRAHRRRGARQPGAGLGRG